MALLIQRWEFRVGAKNIYCFLFKYPYNKNKPLSIKPITGANNKDFNSDSIVSTVKSPISLNDSVGSLFFDSSIIFFALNVVFKSDIAGARYITAITQIIKNDAIAIIPSLSNLHSQVNIFIISSLNIFSSWKQSVKLYQLALTIHFGLNASTYLRLKNCISWVGNYFKQPDSYYDCHPHLLGSFVFANNENFDGGGSL